MTNNRTLVYTLTIEVEVDGTPGHDDEVVHGVAAEIQRNIPGVLCDRESFVVLVNSTELTPANAACEEIADNSQQWAGMDGATAWHLIDRHANNWADIGKMMDEWLAANQALAS